MESLIQALNDLDTACESEQGLVAWHAPDMNAVLAAILALPQEDRIELHGKLGRVRHVMETNLALYGIEKERLRRHLHSKQVERSVNEPYARVAIIPVNGEQHAG